MVGLKNVRFSDASHASARLASVIASNRRWADEQTKRDPEYFSRMANSPQKPEVLFIGCSDSRVPANMILGNAPPGSVFTMRNIANQVLSADMGAMSVIEFAVDVLKVPNIMVVGHYGCNGIKNAMGASDASRARAGALEHWLRHIRDVARLNHEELSTIEDEEQRYRRLVELNVAENCLAVLKTGTVQRARIESPERLPKIHGCVYDLNDGKLLELQINYKHYASKYDALYRLY